MSSFGRRETIEGWVGDFLESPRCREHGGLIQEYAPQVLVAFLKRACQGRDVDPGDLEEGDLRAGLMEGVAPLEMPGSVRPDVPPLVASFLEEMQAQGRLAGGATLGRYVRAMKGAFVDAAAGKGQTITRPGARIGRNDPCPCGSGRKYKKCCLDRLG